MFCCILNQNIKGVPIGGYLSTSNECVYKKDIQSVENPCSVFKHPYPTATRVPCPWFTSSQESHDYTILGF